MASRKLKAKKAKLPLRIYSFSLTAENETVLAEIAGAASDRIGRPVSSSAVVRALLGFVEEQGAGWISQELFSRIEEEIAAGRVWGTKS